MKRRSLLLGSAALLAGCGGGGSKTSSGQGRAVFNVEWPKSTTRLIPAASQSIAVEIRQGGTLLTRQVLARPGTTLTFADLPEGDLTAFAAAYPTSDGTGVPQASGTVPLAIRDGETAQVPLTMASTIASFTISPATLGVGETRRLTATAKDASGATILVPNSQLTIQITGGAANATFDPIYRNLAGTSAGNVTILVTDPESGVSANASVTIGPAAPARPSPVILPSMTHLAGDQTRYLLWTVAVDSTILQALDPDTGSIVYQSTAPGVVKQILLSKDTTVLYYLTQTGELHKFHTSNQTWVFSFDDDINKIITMLPTNTETIIVTDSQNFTSVYDSGVKRPQRVSALTWFDYDGTYAIYPSPPISGSGIYAARYDITASGIINGTGSVPIFLFSVFLFGDATYFYSPSSVYLKSNLSRLQSFSNSINASLSLFSRDFYSSNVYILGSSGGSTYMFCFSGSPLSESGLLPTGLSLPAGADYHCYLGSKRSVIRSKSDSSVIAQVYIVNTP